MGLWAYFIEKLLVFVKIVISIAFDAALFIAWIFLASCIEAVEAHYKAKHVNEIFLSGFKWVSSAFTFFLAVSYIIIDIVEQIKLVYYVITQPHIAVGPGGPGQVAVGPGGPGQVAVGPGGPGPVAVGPAGPGQVAVGPGGPGQVAVGPGGPVKSQSVLLVLVKSQSVLVVLVKSQSVLLVLVKSQSVLVVLVKSQSVLLVLVKSSRSCWSWSSQSVLLVLVSPVGPAGPGQSSRSCWSWSSRSRSCWSWSSRSRSCWSWSSRSRSCWSWSSPVGPGGPGQVQSVLLVLVKSQSVLLVLEESEHVGHFVSSCISTRRLSGDHLQGFFQSGSVISSDHRIPGCRIRIAGNHVWWSDQIYPFL